jgi:hypothetical protein
VSQKDVASIFRGEEKAKQETSFTCCPLHGGFLLGLLFNPKGGSNIFLQYVWVLISPWLFLFPIFLLAAQPKEFFLDGLKKLEQQSHKCSSGGNT